MSAPIRFGQLLRELRADRGWSLRDLGEKIQFNRGYIGKVEQGEKFPDRQFAELADPALAAHGALIDAWQAEAEERRKSERVGRLLTASVKDSLQLMTTPDEQLLLPEIDQGARSLAVDYLAKPPGPMLQAAVELRSEVIRRLRQHHYRPHELADMYVMLGRIQGVLAYAALDLGDADGAMVHANAAWTCAERASDNELRAWVRGTQSLIARFNTDYNSALTYVLDGLSWPTTGTGRLRLLCGLAQCRANLGDSNGANAALDQAQHEREALTSTDSVQGLFTFSEAKQHYYAGSSLIWLPGAADAERAIREARQAIEMWESETPEARSLDDEALAHVYQATAHLQLNELDATSTALRPILDLPEDRQISWIKKRMDRIAGMLSAEKYHGSSLAKDLREEIRSYAA
ncbi:helix-turn-helix domain-containing protein [Micromonospora echinospora]|uniref:helix-turn-helix domain-containing protein n=1 Tax=Micromonospora echinospora TaxID=1877 RepID=UPI003A850F1F